MLFAGLGLAMAFLASRASDSRTPLPTAILIMAALDLVKEVLGHELAPGPDHLGIS